MNFGKTGGSLKSYDLVPLTALSSASDPVLVFLGVQKDGKTAAFLVSSDAAPQGDGHCSPSRSVCATLTVRAGDTVFIDVAASGGNVQYELDVKRVTKRSQRATPHRLGAWSCASPPRGNPTAPA